MGEILGVSNDRPGIPADLERALFVEVGYRCAIPACGATSPLEVEHIEEFSKVKEHTFENMIVLCANHHRQKVPGGGPRTLDRKALKAIKHNLALVNGRYGDIERRVIDYFVLNSEETSVLLPGLMHVLVMRLVDDGLLTQPTRENDLSVELPSAPGVRELVTWQDRYELTDHGRETVGQIRDRLSLD